MSLAENWIKRVPAIAGGLVALLLMAAAGGLIYRGIPQTASGMAAKGVCSAAFVAGRPIATLLAEDVLPASPVLKVIRVTVDEANKSVSARFAGLFERRARWLPNRGCVLDVEPAAKAETLSGRTMETKQSARRAEMPWPEGEATLAEDEWDAGIDVAALQKRIDEAFVGAGDPEAANARGVAVVHHGRLLIRRMAPGFAADTPLHGWSMTKTVTGMLARKLAIRKSLSFDAAVVDAFAPGREPGWVGHWRQDTRKAIKLSDLLYMRDGLASTEDYAPGGSVPRYLWGEKDAAAFAAASPADVPPGTRWRYLGASTNILASVLRSHFATDDDYWAYPRTALFDPIGARTAVMETDTSGNWVGSSYVWASVGDWARLGELMLRDGRWGKRQVLPAGWLKRATMPALPEGEGRGYGAQTWLIGEPQVGDCKGYGLPEDTIAMMGHWGQVVAMVPSRDAVIVRLGWTFRKGQFDDCAFVAGVLKALAN